MNTTKLYIENQEVELNESVQFLLNKQFEDITNPTVIINDWSKTVEIPCTQKNDELFGHIYNPDKIIVEETNPSVPTLIGANELKTLTVSPLSSWYDMTFEPTNFSTNIKIKGLPAAGAGSLTSYNIYSCRYYPDSPYTNDVLIASNVSSVGEYDFEFTPTLQTNAIMLSAVGGTINYPNIIICRNINYTDYTYNKKYYCHLNMTKAVWGAPSNIDLEFDFSVRRKEFTNKLSGIYFNPYKKLNFRLEWNDSVLMSGYAKMNDIVRKDTKTTYNITLNGTLGKLFQEFKKITFDKSVLNNPETSGDTAPYLIEGWNYYKEEMNKDLVWDSWNMNINMSHRLDDAKPYEIVGFTPNNAYSANFDYTAYVYDKDGLETMGKFDELLGDNFLNKTGVKPSVIIGNGLKPRDISEYRSYNQLPFLYFSKFWEIFQRKAEELTDYQWILDDGWFKFPTEFLSTGNPYWNYLAIKAKDFPLERRGSEDSVNNFYNIDSISRFENTPLFWGRYYNTETSNLWGNNIKGSIYMTEDEVVLPVYVVGSSGFDSYFQFTDDFDIIKLPPFNFKIETPDITDTPVDGYFECRGKRLQIKYSLCNINDNTSVKDLYFYAYSNNDKSEATKDNEIIFSKTPTEFQGTHTKRIKWNIVSKEVLIHKRELPIDKFRLIVSFVWQELDGSPFGDYTPYWNTLEGQTVPYLWATEMSIERDRVTIPTTQFFRSFTEFDYNDLWDNSYTPFDFILRYCKMFRIAIYADDSQKKLYFTPISTLMKKAISTDSLGVDSIRDEYIMDWTDKVDFSKEYKIQPISFENKYIKFNYEDSKLKDNDDYMSLYGFNYGEKLIKTEYNFNNDTKNLFEKIKPTLTYTPYVMPWNKLINEQTIEFVLPKEYYIENVDENNKQQDIFGTFGFTASNVLFDKTYIKRDIIITDDSNLETKNETYCYNQLFDNALFRYTNNYTTFDKSIVTNSLVPIYDWFIYYINFNTPNKDYTWEQLLGAKHNDIYSLFWKDYVDERYNKNNKIVTCYVYLTQEDYNNLRYMNQTEEPFYNRYIRINNQLFKLNRIFDYDITNNKPTKVELITIQNPKGYYHNGWDDDKPDI